MNQLPYTMFNVFALALPRGLGFGENLPKNAWTSSDGITVCALTANTTSGKFGVLVMRRREDDVWAVLQRDDDAFSEDDAMAIIKQACVAGLPKVALPPGAKRRPPLPSPNTKKSPSNIFMDLGQHFRERGAWMLNQLYLAMPNPDDNWASDCRTENFHTRLWEAILFASLREQGLLVSQDYPSPDFHVTNRKGGEAWIEAVTANPSVPYDHANAVEVPAPQDLRERMLGSAAVRFAKTIRSKMERGYARMPHVEGKPFVLAIADFHAPGSMMWSRVALIGYLYGFLARQLEVDGQRVAVWEDADTLLGPDEIPAGLFNLTEGEELSAVIFSQGATMSKLSRVAVSFGGQTGDYRYVRVGEFADFTPGAMRGKPFSMDVNTDEYRTLWEPYGYEPWTAEMEIFHNPNARNRVNPALFPEATHWLLVNGEMECLRFFKESILESRTLVLGAHEPVPTVDNLIFRETFENKG